MKLLLKTKAIEFNLEINQKVMLAIILGVTPSDIFMTLHTYLGYLG